MFIQQSLPFSPEAKRRLSLTERLRVAAIAWSMRGSCKRAGLVLVQTPTMKRWVGETFGLASAKIEVVEPCPPALAWGLAPEPSLEPMRAAPIDRRLLYIGNTSAYKNLAILPAAMRALRRHVTGAVLFATVPPGHPVALEEGIQALERLSGAGLREAYELATALVMPSLVETVGLPMLEAASLGVPVIAADRPYARDVCGDAALFFDPLDPLDLAAKLETLLGDRALRQELGERGQALGSKEGGGAPYDRMIGWFSTWRQRKDWSVTLSARA
jgi:glycosyltransferase involved in cell wall biosynthesis